MSTTSKDFFEKWKCFLGSGPVEAKTSFDLKKEYDHERIETYEEYRKPAEAVACHLASLDKGTKQESSITLTIPSLSIADLIHVISISSLAFFIFSYSYGQHYLGLFGISANDFLSLPEYVSAYASLFVLPSMILIICTLIITYLFIEHVTLPIYFFPLIVFVVIVAITFVIIQKNYTIDFVMAYDVAIAIAMAMLIATAMNSKTLNNYLSFLSIVMFFSVFTGFVHAKVGFTDFGSSKDYISIVQENSSENIFENQYKIIATSSSFVLVQPKNSEELWIAIQVKDIASLVPNNLLHSKR
ncbi:hypothetical protein [Halodesulfovibrio marinisediminis]|uniref:Uncharacterized protein n=1 Tax=Halodesulfovibrio marinisediminis DSM 17456 TaxID=1121457 RepID=A0A1N6E893_9BACT|nr:hypothetical protein [Halodesulfovibrio marinisediminis]SIN79265.1 hypothetical protein SAMN02745161_0787 [Halodesulfovibrio marinisediminis DSM 17456]